MIIEVNILTFNIHHGRGTDKKVNLKRISHIIKESNADVIGLNEVDKYFAKRSYFKNQIDCLANDLNMNYVYGPTISIYEKETNVLRQYGNALLTRLPILEFNNIPFDFLPNVIEGRSMLTAKLQIGQIIFYTAVTHLSPTPFLHKKQTSFILEHMNKLNHSIIILGDWNMKPHSKSWKNMIKYYLDAWTVTNLDKGYTYPSTRPKLRLDYIFVTKEINVLQTKVITKQRESSDHLPLFAKVKLPLETE